MTPPRFPLDPRPARRAGRMRFTTLLLLPLGGLLFAAGQLPAASPAPTLEQPLAAGDFAPFVAAADAWLAGRTPANADRAALEALVADPEVRRVIDQRQFVVACGAAELGAFTKAAPANRAFLKWLVGDASALDLVLEGAVPLALAAREKSDWRLRIGALEILERIVASDADARAGMPLRIAVATALAPPGSGSKGAGQANPPVDPVARYAHFKQAHATGQLVPSFSGLTIWELQKVVQSGASNEDLAWGRQMVSAFRPDLLDDEMVVNSTSFVWRRNAPPAFYPFKGYKDVLAGGGKCGPRSSWSVFICQAHGVPAIGVGQPAHACVAFKAANPQLQPQPGSPWKVGFGRGWEVSKLEGMSGPEFLACVNERSDRDAFTLVEHLRWLAAALPAEKAAAVRGVVEAIRGGLATVETDLTASLKPEEAEADPGVNPAADAKPGPVAFDPAAPRSAEPIKATDGTLRVDAAAFAKTGGQISWGGQWPHVLLHRGPDGAEQIYFQQQMKSQWAEYVVDLPAAGDYEVVLQAACINDSQALEVCAGETVLATVPIPLTHGLWQETAPVRFTLPAGVQTLRVQTPTTEHKRGISLKRFELRPKG
jgi:hypothetical protein